jgi:hypothetical protein
MSLRKLIAFDEADLSVLSAHVQDACVKASDMAWLPQQKRFALVAERFCREDGQETSEKRHTGMHFERVTHVKSNGVKPGGPEKMQLLALWFHPTEEPSGTLQLMFAGGAEIRLEVECLEAFMSDLDEGGAIETCPHHNLSA